MDDDSNPNPNQEPESKPNQEPQPPPNAPLRDWNRMWDMMDMFIDNQGQIIDALRDRLGI